MSLQIKAERILKHGPAQSDRAIEFSTLVKLPNALS